MSLSDEGLRFCTSPFEVNISQDSEFTPVSDEDFEKIQPEAVFDKVLFEKLKDLQKQVGKKMGLPPYVIFQETSLEGHGL